MLAKTTTEHQSRVQCARMEVAALLDAIVRLRLAIPHARDGALRGELRDVEVRLRRQLGPVVTKRVAARQLGVSVTALDRWIDRGFLPVVAPSRNSRRLAIESTPLLDLATEVLRIRRSGRSRAVVAEAVRTLGWRERRERLVYSLEVARLPRPNLSLDELQRQFAESTPEARVLQLAALNRSLDVLRQTTSR